MNITIKQIVSFINTFDNRSCIEVSNYKEFDKYYIIDIYGGLNGHGNWKNYSDDINTIFSTIDNSYLISLENDVLDDLWTLKIGIKK